MTAQSHTRRTVLTTGAAVAGAAVGTAALAACGSGDVSAGSSGGADATNGQSSGAPESSASSGGETVTALSDVPVGGATSVKTPDGEEAIVSRRSDTEVAAFSAVCTHQGCTVTPEGADLKCPCHGSLFDAFTGEVKNGPATEALPPINVKVENDQVVTA